MDIFKRKLTFAVFLALLAFCGAAFAADSYNVSSGSTVKVDEWSQCRNVTNAAGYLAILVPTKTATEWGNFLINHPIQVTLASCCVADNGACAQTSDCCSATSACTGNLCKPITCSCNWVSDYFCGGGSCSSSQRQRVYSCNLSTCAGNGNVDCGGASCSAPDWGGAPSGGSTATCASCGAMPGANNTACTKNSDCESNFCTVEKMCCDYGSCGWYSCESNSTTRMNQWLYGVCRCSHWKAVSNGGWGCGINDANGVPFGCDTGACVKNVCAGNTPVTSTACNIQVKYSNGHDCANGADCQSGFCSTEKFCCNWTDAGWGVSGAAECVSNNGTRQNQWLKGVNRCSTWKTQYGGWGCPAFACDQCTVPGAVCKENAVCCRPTECGWDPQNNDGCIADGGYRNNQWLNGVCRGGTWKTVLKGIGCNSYACDQGICVNNTCLKANGSVCAANSECSSGICNYCFCVPANGYCGSGSAPGYAANGSTVDVANYFNGVCNSGVWKVVGGGYGCSIVNTACSGTTYNCASGYTCNTGVANGRCDPPLLANGSSCSANSQCSSGVCNSTYCVPNSTYCGGVANPMYWANGATASNAWLNGVCRNGTWRVVFNGIGCNSFACDSGTCGNNYCKNALGAYCNSGGDCASGSCNYNYCVPANGCGAVAYPYYFYSGQTASNAWLNGICYYGSWMTVYGGIGCSSFPCYQGTCKSNYCR